MEEYLDEMLHLTADIAEELLTIKDTGNPMSDHTAEQIARLAELACSYRIAEPLPSVDRTQSVPAAPEQDRFTETVEKESAEEMLEEEISETEIEVQQEADKTVPDDAVAEADSAIEEQESDAEPDKVEQPQAKPEPEPIGKTVAESVNPPVMPRTPLFSAKDLRNAFTLNDVFLYQRTIFNGSPSQFKAALEEITTFTSADELRDYLVSEYHVDSESPEAEQFINTVSTFFR